MPRRAPSGRAGAPRGARAPAAGPPPVLEAAGASALRAARLARSLSQQQLAELAGVSRQAVAALEAGRSDPSLRVALVIAEALALSVEELFGAGRETPPRDVTPLAPLGAPGARAFLAPVAHRLVAAPLDAGLGVRTGFAPASAIVAGPRAVRLLTPVRPTLVVAGCDPALSLLEAPLAQLDPPISFAWRSCGSGEALDLLRRGLVHAAGVHVRDASGSYNVEVARGHAATPYGPVLGFAAWRQGIVVRPELLGVVGAMDDVAALSLRIVNRERGSEARTLLERACSDAAVSVDDLRGQATEVRGHLEVAAAISAGLADAGIASEPAALAYGLGFVALTQERFDLVVGPGVAGSEEVHALRRVLSSRWLRGQLAAIPGYRPSPPDDAPPDDAPPDDAPPDDAPPDDAPPNDAPRDRRREAPERRADHR